MAGHLSCRIIARIDLARVPASGLGRLDIDCIIIKKKNGFGHNIRLLFYMRVDRVGKRVLKHDDVSPIPWEDK